MSDPGGGGEIVEPGCIPDRTLETKPWFRGCFGESLWGNMKVGFRGPQSSDLGARILKSNNELQFETNVQRHNIILHTFKRLFQMADGTSSVSIFKQAHLLSVPRKHTSTVTGKCVCKACFPGVVSKSIYAHAKHTVVYCIGCTTRTRYTICTLFINKNV